MTSYLDNQRWGFLRRIRDCGACWSEQRAKIGKRYRYALTTGLHTDVTAPTDAWLVYLGSIKVGYCITDIVYTCRIIT